MTTHPKWDTTARTGTTLVEQHNPGLLAEQKMLLPVGSPPVLGIVRLSPPPAVGARKSAGSVLVHFFDEDRYAWARPDDVKAFACKMAKRYRAQGERAQRQGSLAAGSFDTALLLTEAHAAAMQGRRRGTSGRTYYNNC